MQKMDVQDKHERKIEAEIYMHLCFCSKHACNHPFEALYKKSPAGLNGKAETEVSLALLLLSFTVIKIVSQSQFC